MEIDQMTLSILIGAVADHLRYGSMSLPVRDLASRGETYRKGLDKCTTADLHAIAKAAGYELLASWIVIYEPDAKRFTLSPRSA